MIKKTKSKSEKGSTKFMGNDIGIDGRVQKGHPDLTS